MTMPWDVPENTVIVAGGPTTWRVMPHNTPQEMFATRDRAIARANEIAKSHGTVQPWTVRIEPSPGSIADWP